MIKKDSSESGEKGKGDSGKKDADKADKDKKSKKLSAEDFKALAAFFGVMILSGVVVYLIKKKNRKQTKVKTSQKTVIKIKSENSDKQIKASKKLRERGRDKKVLIFNDVYSDSRNIGRRVLCIGVCGNRNRTDRSFVLQNVCEEAYHSSVGSEYGCLCRACVRISSVLFMGGGFGNGSYGSREVPSVVIVLRTCIGSDGRKRENDRVSSDAWMSYDCFFICYDAV